MNKVLVIVHDFPPLGGGGVMRTLKFVKYLPEFGWQPIVFTVDAKYYQPDLLDYTLLEELPAFIKIYRTPSLRKAAEQKASLPASATRGKNPRRGRLYKAGRWLVGGLRMDDFPGLRWLPYAWAGARKVIEREHVDLIFTTSPPHDVHLIGMILSQMYRLPQVADFRDGWMGTAMFVSPHPLRRWFDKACEKGVISNAMKIICATAPIANNFAQRYPRARNKIETLYNGFDPADFAPHSSALKDKNIFCLAYVGSLGLSHRNPEFFLQAVRSLASSDSSFAQKCRIRFVGPVRDYDLHGMIKDYGLSALCSVLGTVPHTLAVQFMEQADVLLLLLNYKQKFGDESILTGKFCEYIGARKPILAMVQEGIAADFVRQYNLGIVVAPEDVPGIEQALRELFYRWQNNTLRSPDASELRELFNRRRSTEKLAGVFNEAVLSIRF